MNCGFRPFSPILSGAILACLVGVTPAVARPLVLNCQVVELDAMPDVWRQIDRIEVDEARSTITFAIARTLGSNDEKAFTYEATRGDQIAFERVGNSLRIVALRLATPTAIWLEPSSVRLVSLSKFIVEQVEFACRQ